MATPTYIALATEVLTGTDSSITFSSIPGTYKDLVLTISGTVSAFSLLKIRFNGDSGSNYGFVILDDDVTSASNASTNYFRTGYLMTVPSYVKVEIFDYSSTDKNTYGLSHSVADRSGVNQSLCVATWLDTTAVTSMEVFGVTFQSGTVLSLFGIEA